MKLDFKLADVQVDEMNLSPVPAGEYICRIMGSETKQTNAGTGCYLNVSYKITEGKHKGKRLWDNPNMANPSEKAVEIGRQTLKKIVTAAGLDPATFEDTDQLAGCYVTCKVEVNGDRNKILAYKKAAPSLDAVVENDDIPF